MLCRHRRSFSSAISALGVWLLLPLMIGTALGQSESAAPSVNTAYYPTAPEADCGYPETAAAWTPVVPPTWGEAPPPAAGAAPADTWIEPTQQEPSYVDADVYLTNPPAMGQSLINPSPPDTWFWQILPEGLIYRSYWAGVHEPRMSLVLFRDLNTTRSFWDAALGGRVGLFRYGNGDVLFPQGWQLDFEGAAMPRLTLDSQRDLESVDFRAGVPITYGVDNWQFKFGFYHLSSHMGDEYAIKYNALGQRINYVRDALVLGASYYPDPTLRLYSEASFAFNATGGAEPWEFQFGAEYSQPGPTGFNGVPFLAVNGQLLEDFNYGGSINAQAGWLWRSLSGQVLRIGMQYYNGHSSQYQFFGDNEQQIGGGIWYDF
jgi:Protein of unknown function (DUF1207)